MTTPAQERFEQLKKLPRYDEETIQFLISLVEAAKFMCIGTDEMFWQEIEQRMKK